MEENNSNNRTREIYKEMRTGKSGRAVQNLGFLKDDIIPRWSQYFFELLSELMGRRDQNTYFHTAELELEPSTPEVVNKATTS